MALEKTGQSSLYIDVTFLSIAHGRKRGIDRRLYMARSDDSTVEDIYKMA